MKQTKDAFTRIQWGLSIWAGDAPHLGKSLAQLGSSGLVKIRVRDYHDNFDMFERAMCDVWTLDGWLICSITMIGNTARCQVRKGTKVATLVTPSDGIFTHNRTDLLHESVKAD